MNQTKKKDLQTTQILTVGDLMYCLLILVMLVSCYKTYNSDASGNLLEGLFINISGYIFCRCIEKISKK
jgi:hypothetical protein